MPGHCESLCTGPSGSVKTIFSFLHEKPGLVKKLAERLQISCPLRRRSAHLDGRRRDPDTWKWPFFVWSVTGSLFPTSKRKTAAVWPQGDQGGDEDDLGWGQAFWYQVPVRRRLTAVVGAFWKVGSDRQYTVYAQNSEKLHFYIQAIVFVLFHLSHLILTSPRT